jgi:tetratricopeptide (TPR) repeat protein
MVPPRILGERRRWRDGNDFSAQTKHHLARSVNYLCSKCGCQTSGPKKGASVSVTIGKAAHISAAAPGGPRYDPTLTPEQRRHYDNGIWMCSNHASLIDVDWLSYSMDQLREMKRAAEERAAKALERASSASSIARASGLIPSRPQPFIAHAYDQIKHFTGRERERQQLTAWVDEGAERLLLIDAMGGEGKTALAWVWLHRDVLGRPLPRTLGASGETRSAFSPKGALQGMLWWSFYESTSPDGFMQFVDQSIHYCNPSDVESLGESAAQRVQRLLRLLEEHRVLLVLDGLERQLTGYADLTAVYRGDFDIADPSGRLRTCATLPLRNFLLGVVSRPLQGFVLATTRVTPRELDERDGWRSVKLSGLDPDAAVAFMRARGVKRGTNYELRRLCQQYDNNALALKLLGSYIARDRRQAGEVSLGSQYSPLADLKGQRQHHVIGLAYGALSVHSQRLLSAMASIRSSAAYDTVAFMSELPESCLNESLDECVDRGLLFVDADASTYDMHPLVRQFAYEKLLAKEEVHGKLWQHYGRFETTGEIHSLEQMGPAVELFRHALLSGRFHEARQLFSDRLYGVLHYRFSQMDVVLECADALIERTPQVMDQSESLNMALVLHHVALAASLAGQPKRALEMTEAANRIGEMYDASDEFRPHRLWNLAFHQFRLGQLRNAHANFAESLDRFVKAGDSFRERNVRIHYAVLLGVLGEYEEAMQQFEAAHPGPTNQSRRAQVCILAGRVEEAIALSREARKSLHGAATQRDILRADWICAAAVVASLKGGSEDTAAWQEAEQLLQVGLRTARRTGLQEYEAQILIALAQGQLVQNHTEEARDCADEARAISVRAGYRLWQADAHAVLSQIAARRHDSRESREQAMLARACAICDGPPFAYSSTLSVVSTLLED